MSETHPSITALLAELAPEQYGWIVMNQFDPELCTVGFISFKRSNRIVYVSTLDHDLGRYSYICEVANEKKLSKSYKKENVTMSALREAMIAHLE